jgi:hypothetical protein
MESTANGRGGSFLGGANTGVRGSEFHTMQQANGPVNFAPTSVLDKSQVLRGANGTSETDRNHQMVTGQSRNSNGQSSTTFDDRLWIGNKSRTFG